MTTELAYHPLLNACVLSLAPTLAADVRTIVVIDGKFSSMSEHDSESRSIATACYFIKGAPPFAADPGGFLDFGIFGKMLIFENFR